MGRFDIIESGASPSAFGDAVSQGVFADPADHPVYGRFGRAYYPVALGGAMSDRAFAVVDGERPALLVECSVREGVLSHFGFPLRFVFAPDLAPKARRKCLNAAFEQLGKIASEDGAETAVISGGPAGTPLSGMDQACLERGGTPGLKIRAEAELAQSEEELKRGLRDSYKSLINWGSRNIRLAYANAENPDREFLAALAGFHAKTAGRAVHGPATWDALFAPVADGHGEISLGYLEDGELVAGTLIVDEGPTAMYCLAVYDRERFDKPMGHWPLFDAMLRAKARGRERFDFGDVPPRGTVGDKEYNIGFFKKGFTPRLVAETVWTVPLGGR